MDLSNLDRLLVAQTVYELGSDAWPSVAKLLSKHPLLNHPNSFYTVQSCQAMYAQLMADADLEINDERNKFEHAPAHLALARKHYETRMFELRDLIAAEEAKFRAISTEIADLQKKKAATVSEDKPLLVSEEIATELPPTELPPTELPPTELPPTELPPTELPSTELPPTELPSTELPPTELPSTELPPTELPSTELPQVIDEQTKETPTEVQQEPVPLQRDATPEQVSTPKDPEVDTPELADNAAEDETSGDEVVQPTRRSKRARSSAVPLVPPLTTRSANKGRGRRPTSEQPLDIPEPPAEPTPKIEETAAPEPATIRRQSKRKASVLEEHDGSDKKRLREESEPIEEEPQGQSSNTTRSRRKADRTEEQVANKRFQNVIGLLHSQISQHRNGNIFHNPIKKSEAPDYMDIVKRPIDLKTIKTKIKDGIITNSLEYQRDIYLMFANAMMYNRPGSDIYHMAEDMMFESENNINSFRQTEGLMRGPK